MAKVLYGVMGNTHGHIMRTQAITARLPGHEIRIVGGGRVPAAFARTHVVHEVPVLRTVHKDQRVDMLAIVGQIAQRLAEIPRIVQDLIDLIHEFKPDVAVTDREFFLPIACRLAGVPCFSVDHSHVMKAGEYPVPQSEQFSWTMAMLNDYALFDFTDKNLAVSFFHPPQRPGNTDEVLPPVLRTAVREQQASEGDYILVYQSSPTFGALMEMLKLHGRPCRVYGFRNESAVDGCLQFKPYDPVEILRDLAGCRSVIANGGHNLLCEAFYFGKPVLSFPITNLFEQFINAWHVRSLGYGEFSQDRSPRPELLERFEARHDFYKNRIATGFRDGTEEVAARVDRLIGSYRG